MSENLVVTGEFPESLDALKEQFDPEDYYEIPLEVTYSTIGYSHYEPVEERHFYISQNSKKS